MDSKKRRNRDVKNALSGIHFYTSSIPSEMVKKVENGIMYTGYGEARDGGPTLRTGFYFRKEYGIRKGKLRLLKKGKAVYREMDL